MSPAPTMPIVAPLLACWLTLACPAATTLQPPPAAPAPHAPEPTTAKRKIEHLRLRGDLDSVKVIADLERTLAKAREENVDIVVLELGGKRWRADVLPTAMRLVGSSSPRIIVWLNGGADGQGAQVGSGQLALALCASRCYLSPKAELVYDASHELRDLAPAATSWEQVDRDVQSALWSALTAHKRDALYAAALPTPRQQVWALLDHPIPSAPGAKLERLVSAEPSLTDSARSIAIITGAVERGGLKMKLDAPSAVAAGLCDGLARDVGQILALEHLAPHPLVRDELASGLPDARTKLKAELACIDAAAEKLDKALDEAERFKGMEAAKRKAKVGREQTPIAEDASRKLEAVEQLVVDYPELLRAAPPGATQIELTPQRLSSLWHYAFQDRRTKLTELRARAVRLAE